jgi:DNA-binding NarL/FixJ family response regulator
MAIKKLTNLFIIEDTVMDRTMLTDHLSKYPTVTVKGFYTGDACIKDIINGKAVQPDLILMDFFLDASIASKRDGLETLDKIKEISPDTEVIMLTSVENPRIIELAQQKGALDYIIKGKDSFQKLDTVLEKHFSF